MESNEQPKILNHVKLAEKIDNITRNADIWQRELTSMMKDPDILLWKMVDIDASRQVLGLFSDSDKGGEKEADDYILSLKAAQHSLLNPESKREESLSHLKESIYHIKVDLKGVHEIPKRIDFIESDCVVLEKRMALLIEQRTLIKRCLERLRQPGIGEMMRLVENLSDYNEKKEMKRANRIIDLMGKSSLDEDDDGMAAILSSIRSIDKALSSYEIAKDDTFHVFSQIFSVKYRHPIHSMVQSLITKLDDLYKKNNGLVQNHKNERKSLISPPNSENIDTICREYERRATHYRDFLLSVSRGSDLPERIKFIKSIRSILRQLTDNLDHIEDEMKTTMGDASSQFYLKPALFSETAYHLHLGRFKKIVILPINFVRKLFGKKVIEKETFHDFFKKNSDYALDETPIKMRVRVNAFLRKEKYPEKIGKFLEESFYQYLRKIEKYIGEYRQDRSQPNVNLYMKQLEKRLEDF